MSAKTIEIEIIDKKLQETTTGGGVETLHVMNVPNHSFTSALSSSNIGQAGCTTSFTQSYSYIGLNLDGAGGTPTNTNWSPCSFKEAAGGGNPSSFCGIFYRETPIPYRNGIQQCVFPGTQPTYPIFNYVARGNFEATYGGSNPGFINDSVNIVTVGAGTKDVVGQSIIEGNISTSTIQVPPNYWWGAKSQCYPTGQSTNGPAQITSPFIDESPFPMPPTSSLGVCTLYAGATNFCWYSGTNASSGIYQRISALTAGVTYNLTIKLAQNDTLGGGELKIGSHKLDNGTSVNGDTYINLGGDNALIYGSNGAGEYEGTGTTSFSCQTTAEQSFTFVAQGGNEVLCIEYLSKTPYAATYGGDIIIDYVNISETFLAPYNIGTIYALADANNTPSGSTTNYGSVVIDVVQCDLAKDMVAVSQSSFPITGATGLSLLSPPIRLSNNPAWNPTHPLTLGINQVGFLTNQNVSVAPFSSEDRFYDLTVVSETGQDVIIGSADYQYSTYSQSVTTQTIDYEKSIVGKLEVTNSEDFPLNLSYNISDGKDLENRFGDYSQTFDIPANANNNKLLNNIWKPTVDQSQKRTFGIKECRVLVDGLPFFNGSVQVKTSSQKDSPDSYSCTLYGGNFSWMSLLKDKFLCETFGEDEEFLYSYQEIENTWLKTQANSYIQYPLISYKDFNEGGTPNYVNTFDESKLPDFQPAYYVKTLLEKIVAGIGYTIDSNFFNTHHFSRLINTFPFLSNSAVDDGIHYSSTQGRQVDDVQTVQSCTGLGSLQSWSTVKLNQNDGDPSNSYDNATGVWTCQKAGQYSVNAQMGFLIALASAAGGECNAYCNSGSCDWSWTPTDPSDSWTWTSRVKVSYLSGGTGYIGTTANGWGQATGSPLDWYLDGCGDTSTQFTTIPSGSVILGVGDTIELQGRHIGQNLLGCEPLVKTSFGYTSSTIPLGGQRPQMSITFDDAAPKLGGNIKYNNVLPCGVSQVEYIKSIAQLFNLYFTTDVQSKTIYIEPFNEFYKPKSEGVDWDMKVDYTKEIIDDYDIGLKRELTIGYKKDGSDVFAKEQNFKANIYGDTTRLYDYNENLGDDYESGNVKIINPIFASTTQVWDNDAHDSPDASKAPVLIPNLWNMDCYAGIGLGNNQWRPTEIISNFVPRIFYYCWENPVSYTTIQNGMVANASGTQTYWSRIFSNGSSYQNQTVYPRATFVDWEERIHSMVQRPSLSFADETFTAPGQFQVNEVPGLYTMYYKNMIEQLKASPRIRTVYVGLTITDILNLDLRKLVYLDGSWWRVNRVSEFSPANNQSTKVELIQWLDVGYYPVYQNTDIINYT